MQSDPARLGYGGVGVYGRSIEALASDPKVQAQIIAALQAKERAGKVAESEVVLPGTAPNVGGLIQAGRNILEPPKPIKAETERAPTITVSSLRSIGGGVAGENLFVEQNIPKAQLDALQSIDKNIKILVGDKSPDLTKPPSGAPGSGLASNN